MYDTLASPPPAPEPSASAVEQMALMDSRRQQAQRMALQEHSEQAPRQGHARPPAHKLSEAELTRQQAIIDQAYNSFSQVLADDPSGPFAGMARSEILLLAQHFRNLELFKNAADLLDRFCTDFPNDGQLPELVAWANTDLYEHARHSPVVPGDAYLTELVKRFDAVRARYDAFVERFADENALVASARLARAETWVKEATLAVGRSRSFASGRFQRAVREYQALAADESEAVAKFDLPAAIENIAAAMRQAEFFEESISTRTLVITHWPLRAIELRCGLVIAETYESDLNNPLAAAEVYQELLHQFPPSDSEWLTQRILDIGESLHRAKRFIEAMHVLETFVQNHPRHEQASRSLLSVGNIHAENRSWSDAIDAYLKVERDYPACPELADARWGIAECRIQQSEWSDALSAYRRFVEDHPDHPSTDEARRRQETLKDILRFEGLLADGSNGRKAADAQFQIAILVRDQLSNRIKAAAEFAELTERFGDSHLADDAQFALGEALLALEQYDRAREALARVSERFANSPLADDALFLMGRSFEEEADRLAGLTLEDAKEAIAVLGQRRAFDKAQQERAARGKAARRKLSDFRQQQDELNFDIQIASNSALENAYRFAESRQAGNEADADVARESAIAIARRQDRISAALRQSVAAYGLAAQRHPLGDQTDDALLRMARIYSDRLRDTEKAMQTYEQIVTHFSGTSVAEDAAWMIADFYQQQKRFADAVESLESFIRNYQQSTRVPDAQYRLAESLEATGRWVEAMDAYTTYVGKFPDGPRAEKAREQVTWIKAYRL
jgi:TolA-binding protein